MNRFSKLSALAAVLVATASYASADTFYLGSYGSLNNDGSASTAPAGVINTAAFYAAPNGYFPVFGPQPTSPNPTGPMNPGAGGGELTYNLLNPGSVWTGPLTTANGSQTSYVGINPGDGPNGGNVEPNGDYIYLQYFTLPANGLLDSGTLSLLADDTADVYLNGHQVFMDSNLTSGGYPHCSATTPNCLTVATMALDPSFFAANGSVNILQVNLIQGGEYSNGFDFAGTISQTPEPNTLMLLGTGLVGSAGALFRRMRA